MRRCRAFVRRTSHSPVTHGFRARMVFIARIVPVRRRSKTAKDRAPVARLSHHSSSSGLRQKREADFAEAPSGDLLRSLLRSAARPYDAGPASIEARVWRGGST